MVEYTEDIGFRDFAGTPANPSQVSEQSGPDNDTLRVAETLLGAITGIETVRAGRIISTPLSRGRVPSGYGRAVSVGTAGRRIYRFEPWSNDPTVSYEGAPLLLIRPG